MDLGMTDFLEITLVIQLERGMTSCEPSSVWIFLAVFCSSTNKSEKNEKTIIGENMTEIEGTLCQFC